MGIEDSWGNAVLERSGGLGLVFVRASSGTPVSVVGFRGDYSGYVILGTGMIWIRMKVHSNHFIL